MNRTAAVLMALAMALWSAPAAAAEKKMLGEGEGVFRRITLEALSKVVVDAPLTPKAREALGLTGAGPFRLPEIGGELLVLEFYNSSCYACAMQAPLLDQAYEMVHAKPELREKVRFLGIGVGNTPLEVETYRARYGVPFPLVPDPDLVAYDSLGNTGGTPLLILWPLRGPGAAVGARAHVGLFRDPDRLLREIEGAVQGIPLPEDVAAMAQGGAGWRNLAPPLSESELRARLQASAAEVGMAEAAVSPVKLGEETYYLLRGGGRSLWAKVGGRAKICNVCHDIFFVVLFDDGGKVVNFTPIHLTKYKNEELNAEDIAFLKGRVVGRYLTQEIVFDPQVDAVSAATMSSALIFDTLKRLRAAVPELQKAPRP